MENQHFELTREELYEQVWSRPVIHLAKEYGLSDVGLKKICKKHNIPTPPLGYWAKVRAGQKPKKKALQSLQAGEATKILVGQCRPNPARHKKQPVADELQVELSRAAEGIASFDSGDEIVSLHALARLTKKCFKGSTMSYSGLLIPRDRCPDVQVTRDCLDRAIKFLDVLFRLIEHCGYKISLDERGNATLDIFGEKMAMRVKERVKREKLTKPKDPKLHTRKLLAYVSPDANDHYTYSEYSYTATGELCFIIKSLDFYMSDRRWCDKEAIPIETQLPKIIPSLVKFAARSRNRRDEQEELRRRNEMAEAERKELFRMRMEAQRIAEEEKQRVDTFIACVESWRTSRDLREFIDAKRQLALKESGSIDSELGQWIRWAEEQADRIDPLTPSPPSRSPDRANTHELR